ncbi:unnamed protein product [Pleuronectes platessa]|uniref:Uncharacterized protein n=1 Tax=Pleuronectes platessa TaxID=8262 RepID=A0A9N7UWL2_PLEPL|nr:unnamed protein product [Pleuronectes platessa]
MARGYSFGAGKHEWKVATSHQQKYPMSPEQFIVAVPGITPVLSIGFDTFEKSLILIPRHYVDVKGQETTTRPASCEGFCVLLKDSPKTLLLTFLKHHISNQADTSGESWYLVTSHLAAGLPSYKASTTLRGNRRPSTSRQLFGLSSALHPVDACQQPLNPINKHRRLAFPSFALTPPCLPLLLSATTV